MLKRACALVGRDRRRNPVAQLAGKFTGSLDFARGDCFVSFIRISSLGLQRSGRVEGKPMLPSGGNSRGFLAEFPFTNHSYPPTPRLRRTGQHSPLLIVSTSFQGLSSRSHAWFGSIRG